MTDKIKNKIIVTMGPQGCFHNEIMYPVKEVEVKDVSGAGDTFLSGLCYKFLLTNDIAESLNFANDCATKVVQRRGVSTV